LKIVKSPYLSEKMSYEIYEIWYTTPDIEPDDPKLKLR